MTSIKIPCPAVWQDTEFFYSDRAADKVLLGTNDQISVSEITFKILGVDPPTAPKSVIKNTL